LPPSWESIRPLQIADRLLKHLPNKLLKAGRSARFRVMKMRNAWLPCLVLLTIPSLLAAQNNQERKTVRAKGALKAVAGGAIQIVSEDGEQWVVKVDPRSKYNVFQGSADVSFLKPGLLVEFRGSFDKKGKPQSQVSALKIFSPREDSKLGLKPVSGGIAAGGLFSDKDEEEQKKKKKTPAPVFRPFVVTGPIRSIKDNKLAVVAGGALLRVELADKVQIAFNLADFRYARQGDTVEVSGWSYPEQANLVVASRLTITAAKPLGLKNDKSKQKSKVPDLNSLDDF